MQHIEIWKIGTDLLLFLSLVWLGIRFLRSSSSAAKRELATLDTSLRGLLRDADEAGRTLNDQLSKRERSLERLLYDLEGAEHKVNEAVARSESALSAVERREAAPVRESPMPRTSAPTPRTRARESVEQAPTYQESTYRDQENLTPISYETDEPPSFESAAQVRPVGKNIFGEPLGSGPKTARAPEPKPAPVPAASASRVYTRATERYSKTLSGSVEKEVVPSAPPSQRKPLSEKRELSQVLAAAEKLLKAGKDLSTVASVTQLPVDDVARLEKAMKLKARSVMQEEEQEITENISFSEDSEPEVVEAEPVAIETKDTRLGVLGSMKRQVQVL